MPSTTKTLTGPSRASKYPYRYQQDVQDRNDFRMKMKAELKAMAKESFLEEMEKLRSLNGGNEGASPPRKYQFDGGFDVHSSNGNGMAKFQRVVNDMQYRQKHGHEQHQSMQLEWSTPMVRYQDRNQDSGESGGGLLTARTDPGNARSSQGGDRFSPARPLKKKSSGGSRNRGDAASMNQMFVLSAAPIQSHEKLIHDQITMGSSAAAAGVGGSLDSSSLLDQANRYSELQSLFQPPILHRELLMDTLADPRVYDESYDSQESDLLLQQQQQQQRQILRDKLESNIAQHKDRLHRSRQEDRVYHSGLLAKSAQSNKPSHSRSSYSQHHRGRRLVDTSNSSSGGGNYNSQQQYASRRDDSPMMFLDLNDEGATPHSRSNSPKRMLVFDTPAAASASAAAGGINGTIATTNNGGRPTTAHQPTTTTTTINPTASDAHQRSNNSLLTTDSMLLLNNHPTNQNNHPVNHPGKSPDATTAVKGSTAGNLPTESVVMSVEDFQKKADMIDEALKKVIRDAVHMELTADGRAHHYTKRVMNKMLKDKETPLVDRIEKSVGEKLQALQKELDMLKTKKLRRFKRKGKRTNNTTSHPSTTNNNDAGSVNNVDDDSSFFGGYYDIDEDELPNWLKNSGEILHVLEKTQMASTSSPGGGDDNNSTTGGHPQHIDVRMLNSEINRAIEMTLRRLLVHGSSGAGQGGSPYDHHHHHPDYYDSFNAPPNHPQHLASDKLMGDFGASNSGKTMSGNNSTLSVSKVHGRIETGKDNMQKSMDSFGDFDAKPPNINPGGTNLPGATTHHNSAVGDPTAGLTDLPTSIKEKKKSKAAKLLGLDGPGGGPGGPGGPMMMNSNMPMDMSSASTKPGGSLFGQLGNLFSSKPGAAGGNAMSSSGASSRPSMMSMMSSRESVGGGGGGHGSNNSSYNNSPAQPMNGPPSALRKLGGGAGGANASMMAPIIDEGDEESSNRSAKKPRPGSRNNNNNSDSPTNKANKLLNAAGNSSSSSSSNNNNTNSMKKKTDSSESMASIHSKDGDGVNPNDAVDGDDGNHAAAPAPKAKLPQLNPALFAELNREESKYRELMQNLLSLADVKASIKRELKDWEREFTMRTGREASADDKAVINDRYIAYKLATTQVQEAKDHVRACEDKLKEIRERAASVEAMGE